MAMDRWQIEAAADRICVSFTFGEILKMSDTQPYGSWSNHHLTYNERGGWWEWLILSVCDDCLSMIANGECEFPSEEAEQQWRQGWERMWAEGGWDVHYDCPDNCDGGFSWEDCEGCGSRLGGDRHPAIAMRRPPHRGVLEAGRLFALAVARAAAESRSRTYGRTFF